MKFNTENYFEDFFQLTIVALILFYVPFGSLIAIIFKDLSLLKPYQYFSAWKLVLGITLSYGAAYVYTKLDNEGKLFKLKYYK